MTKKTKLLVGSLFVLVIFFVATFLKNWGTAVSETMLEKHKPEVEALVKNPKLAKAKCPAIQARLKKHIPDLILSQDKTQVPLAHKLIADCAFAAETFEEAIEHYKKLSEFEPNSAIWHAQIAQSYYKLGKSGDRQAFGDALSPSILATQLAPQDFKVRRLNARVLAALGLKNRAIAAYAEAIRIAPYHLIDPTKKELQSVMDQKEVSVSISHARTGE
ncbi:hypothetical protein [Methylophilus methylotrophus]|uniref:hypothetical protein n=1 Tax=Methylophilus methylotrophus TaxID=17 RepID=UPI00036E26AF|nr:hypothetical protein [Methylophilus methylotrophus]